MSIAEQFQTIRTTIPEHVTLVAVSKTKPVALIQEAYSTGHRIFGENRMLEMAEKAEQMPKDIAWHMIGHVQTNKVKYIAPFVAMIHAVDSEKLLKEINKQAARHGRIIDVLLQQHIAREAAKHGLTAEALDELVYALPNMGLEHVRIRGLMGMATFTSDEQQVRSEFKSLKTHFDVLRRGAFLEQPSFDTLSMGMSGDYEVAIQEGSTMVRIGSALFGARN